MHAAAGALTLFVMSFFQQRTRGWDRDLSKTHFTSTIAKATCLSSTMHEAGWKWPGNTLLLNKLIQHWPSPQSKLHAPCLWRLTLYSLRVSIGTQRHNFENIWWLSWNFATKIVVKICSLKSQNSDPFLSKTWLTTPTSFLVFWGCKWM